jgi:hypothetical protein
VGEGRQRISNLGDLSGFCRADFIEKLKPYLGWCSSRFSYRKRISNFDKSEIFFATGG